MHTWLRPYARVWYRVYPESAPPFRQMAHYLKPLEKAHPPERIATELAGYLQRTEPRFVSLPKFAACFGSWSVKPDAPRPRPAHFQSADEADRKAGIPLPGARS